MGKLKAAEALREGYTEGLSGLLSHSPPVSFWVQARPALPHPPADLCPRDLPDIEGFHGMAGTGHTYGEELHRQI